MGDDFVKTEELVEKYLKKLEKEMINAMDRFKKEGIYSKKFMNSFHKKAIER